MFWYLRLKTIDRVRTVGFFCIIYCVSGRTDRVNSKLREKNACVRIVTVPKVMRRRVGGMEDLMRDFTGKEGESKK